MGHKQSFLDKILESGIKALHNPAGGACKRVEFPFYYDFTAKLELEERCRLLTSLTCVFASNASCGSVVDQCVRWLTSPRRGASYPDNSRVTQYHH